jgi:hypothetical protein
MLKKKTNKEVTTEASMLMHKKRVGEEKIKLMRKN